MSLKIKETIYLTQFSDQLNTIALLAYLFSYREIDLAVQSHFVSVYMHHQYQLFYGGAYFLVNVIHVFYNKHREVHCLLGKKIHNLSSDVGSNFQIYFFSKN